MEEAVGGGRSGSLHLHPPIISPLHVRLFAHPPVHDKPVPQPVIPDLGVMSRVAHHIPNPSSYAPPPTSRHHWKAWWRLRMLSGWVEARARGLGCRSVEVS